MADQKIILPVSGMTCTNCAHNIERSVNKLDGVKESFVNFASENVSVLFDSKKIGLNHIIETIHKSGFSVPRTKAEFAVTGMTCANCAMNIERTLNKKVLFP